MKKQTPLKTIFFSYFLILVCLPGYCQSAYAQSVYEPILETLEYRQLQQQMAAAPSGADQPLNAPQRPLQIQAQIQPIDQPSVFEERSKQQQPISLEEEIETQIVQKELEQFGYDLFRSAPSTFAQVEDLPVPAGYLVGPGDSITVQIYGARNVEYSLVVTRDGKLLLPELGPMEVSGMSFEELKISIANRYNEQMIGAKAIVSMNQLRTIQIRLTGEVEQPGTYTVSGLATLVDALLSTGGVRYSGSLRKIEVKRRGETITRLDLYDLLMSGDTSKDIALTHNDVIYIPPIGDVVYVGGEVQRPAIYELKNETTLKQVIELAGGLLANASIESSHIERIVNRRYKTLIDLIPSSSDFSSAGLATGFHSRESGNELPYFEIKAGDFVRILPVAETMDDVILLSGHVKRPGGYQYQTGARISNILLNRDQIMPNTDLDFALLIREQIGTRRTEVEFINLTDALMQPGSLADISLRPRDEIRLFNLQPDRANILAGLVSELDLQGTDYRPSQTASVLGHARFTGRFPLENNLPMLDFLRISGGLRQGIDMDYLVIARTIFPQNEVVMTSYSLDAAIRSQASTELNPVVQPGDRIYLFDDRLDRSALMKADLDKLRAQSNYTDNELLVRANGLFAHPGLYPLEQGMRASDLVCAAGGLAATAFGLQAELSRYQIIDGDKRQLDHILLSSEDLVGLCKEQQMASSQTRIHRQKQENLKYGRIGLIGGLKAVTNIIDPVYFDSGKSNLPSDDLERLREAISHYKKQGAEVRVAVIGHTDSTPLSTATKTKYGSNQGLSEARAAQVAEFIQIALRLNSYEMEIKGVGATQPAATNQSSEGRSLNRRTEIALMITGGNLDQPDTRLAGLPSSGNGFPGESQRLIDNDKNPLLKPHDQLTFVQKPNWIEKAMVELKGEVVRPGLYVIDRGETLCEVMKRAGGVTEDAYVFGSQLSRKSIREMQQKTLDSIQDQLDDILVELSMSHSARNNEKTPAGDSKDEYLRIIEQLDRATPNGRLVIDLDAILDCERKAKVVLEDGDVLSVPRTPTYVNVAGQVYVPTSHMYREGRDAEDYIELSGGGTVIGRVKDTYIIQANGEVMSYTGSRSSNRITRAKIQPGAEIVVPLNLDRMNGTERVQSWTRSLMETALFAGILL